MAYASMEVILKKTLVKTTNLEIGVPEFHVAKQSLGHPFTRYTIRLVNYLENKTVKAGGRR